MSGLLKIHVKFATNLPKTDDEGTAVTIRVSIKNQISATTQLARTKNGATKININETITIDCRNVGSKEKVLLEVLDAQRKVLATVVDEFEMIIGIGSVLKNYELSTPTGKPAGKITVAYDWSPSKVQKSEDGKKRKLDSSVDAQQALVSTPLAPSPSTRPDLLRISFYYSTGKNLYDYTKAIRVFGPIMQFGEKSTNYVLSKIGFESVNSTTKIDQQLVPWFENVDDKVDEQLCAIVSNIAKGQKKLLETKDVAVEKVNQVAMKTVDSVSKVTHVALTTVSSASTSTYKNVSNAAVYLLSYVPVVGKKVTAA